MKTGNKVFSVLSLSLILFVSGCRPGQLFGPTITSTPTSTQTSTYTPTFTSTNTFTPTITLTPTPTPIPEIKLAPLELEKAVMASPELSFHMKLKQGKDVELYNDVIETFAKAQGGNWPNYRYALMGVSNPTPNQFLNFLKNNYGPDGNPYWLPGEVNNEILTLYRAGSKVYTKSAGEFSSDPQLAKGIYLDSIRVAVYIWKDYQNNFQLNRFITDVLETNENEAGKSLYDGTYHALDTGMLITSDQRIMLVAGSLASPPVEAEPIVRYRILGGSKGEFRDNVDPRTASAMILSYLKAFREWNHPNFIDYPYGMMIVWKQDPYSKPHIIQIGIYVGDLKDEDILFSAITASP